MRYLHPHVPTNTIHKSKELEAAQCPSMDKENGVHDTHTVEYYAAFKKEYHMGE